MEGVNKDVKTVATISGVPTADKSTIVVVLCFVSILIGIIPIQLNKRLNCDTDDKTGNGKSPKIIKILLGLGEGGLLSTTFLHMLPEVIECVEIMVAKKKLPYTHLACIGFLIIYLVVVLVQELQKEAMKKTCQDEAICKDSEKEDDRDNNLVGSTESRALEHVHRGQSHCYGHVHIPIPASVTDSIHERVLHSLNHIYSLFIKFSKTVLFVLSIHEFLGGLSIRLEGAASDVWCTFIAVAAHNSVIAFCIGVELVASKTEEGISEIYICVFAIVSSLGIALGMLSVDIDYLAENGPVPVIFQGIATAILLYVVFFEISHRNRDGLHQYIAILIGFLLMWGLQIAMPQHHPHGDNMDVVNIITTDMEYIQYTIV